MNDAERPQEDSGTAAGPDAGPATRTDSPVPEDSGAEGPIAGRHPRWNAAREWIGSLMFTIAFVVIFTSYVAQATQVPTESMKPAIMVGDHFFLDKLAFPANYPGIVQSYLPERTLERGDVVAFRSPEGGDIPFVKRIIGIPGDTIDIRDKVVYINGDVLEEPYKIHVDTHVYTDDPWTPESLRVRDNYGPVHLPDDAYFVMGDNRDNSNDSRYWGWIRSDDVIGKPLFVYWSYEGGSWVPGRRTLGQRLRGYASIAANFLTGTRWFRFGRPIR